MEQSGIPKKIQKYIVAYRFLIDAMDEYREELRAAQQENCREERKQDIYDKITNRCQDEGKAVFGLLPKQERKFRRIRRMKYILKPIEYIMFVLSGVCAIELVIKRELIWFLLILLCFTAGKICSKIMDIMRDKMVWTVACENFKPADIVWSDEQAGLVPQRLMPYLMPLTNGIDTDNRVRAKIKCTCGCERFKVFKHPTKGYFKAQCTECKRDIVLFDEHLDAHDADGKAQNYFSNKLQMALCIKCKNDSHQVILTAASDKNRTFFNGEDSDESGYILMFQMFCAECGARSGSGRYFWSNEYENQEQEEERKN